MENLTGYVFTAARNEAARLFARKSREHRRHGLGLVASDLFCEATGDDPATREAVEELAAALSRAMRSINVKWWS